MKKWFGWGAAPADSTPQVMGAAHPPPAGYEFDMDDSRSGAPPSSATPVAAPAATRVGSHPAATAVASSRGGGGGPWNCPACTLQNPTSSKTCNACGYPRGDVYGANTDSKAHGTWCCPSCTFENGSNDTLLCEMCGQERPLGYGASAAPPAATQKVQSPSEPPPSYSTVQRGGGGGGAPGGSAPRPTVAQASPPPAVTLDDLFGGSAPPAPTPAPPQPVPVVAATTTLPPAQAATPPAASLSKTINPRRDELLRGNNIDAGTQPQKVARMPAAGAPTTPAGGLTSTVAAPDVENPSLSRGNGNLLQPSGSVERSPEAARPSRSSGFFSAGTSVSAAPGSAAATPTNAANSTMTPKSNPSTPMAASTSGATPKHMQQRVTPSSAAYHLGHTPTTPGAGGHHHTTPPGNKYQTLLHQVPPSEREVIDALLADHRYHELRCICSKYLELLYAEESREKLQEARMVDDRLEEAINHRDAMRTQQARGAERKALVQFCAAFPHLTSCPLLVPSENRHNMEPSCMKRSAFPPSAVPVSNASSSGLDAAATGSRTFIGLKSAMFKGDLAKFETFVNVTLKEAESWSDNLCLAQCQTASESLLLASLIELCRSVMNLCCVSLNNNDSPEVANNNEVIAASGRSESEHVVAASRGGSSGQAGNSTLPGRSATAGGGASSVGVRTGISTASSKGASGGDLETWEVILKSNIALLRNTQAGRNHVQGLTTLLRLARHTHALKVRVEVQAEVSLLLAELLSLFDRILPPLGIPVPTIDRKKAQRSCFLTGIRLDANDQLEDGSVVHSDRGDNEGGAVFHVAAAGLWRKCVSEELPTS